MSGKFRETREISRKDFAVLIVFTLRDGLVSCGNEKRTARR